MSHHTIVMDLFSMVGCTVSFRKGRPFSNCITVHIIMKIVELIITPTMLGINCLLWILMRHEAYET